MKYLFFVALSAMMLFSCKSTQKTTQTPENAFTENHRWTMISFNGQSPEEAGFNDRIPFFILNREKSSIGGNSGCNSFNGNATVGDKTIEFGMLMSTKMFCAGVPETEFFNILDGPVNFQLKNGELTLSKDGATMIFELQDAQ